MIKLGGKAKLRKMRRKRAELESQARGRVKQDGHAVLRKGTKSPGNA